MKFNRKNSEADPMPASNEIDDIEEKAGKN